MSKSNASKPVIRTAKKVKSLKTTSQIPMEKVHGEQNKKKVSKSSPGAVRVCTGCDAVSKKKRWVIDSALHIEYSNGGNTEKTLCPGCQRLKDKRMDGIIELKGDLVKIKTQDIMNMLNNILEDAMDDDPVHRILSTDITKNVMTVRTTSIWLAETIGKAIHRQYKGKLEIHYSHDEEFVRVFWVQEGAK